MGRMTTEGFMKKVGSGGGGGKFSNWKKEGKTVGWIHPKLGIYECQRHGAIPVESERDGKTETKRRRFVCSGKNCAMCALIEFAEQAVNDGADPKDVIISGGSEGSFTLAELGGRGAWQTKLYAKNEYAFAWIPRDNRKDDSPAELIMAGEGLGYAIKSVIESEIDDRGSKKGDPLKNPYAMKLIYKKDQTPSNMYDAARVSDDIAEIDSDVKEIMDADGEDLGIDLEKITEESDPATVVEAIGSCWSSRVIPFEEFLSFIGIKIEKDDEEEKPKHRGKKKSLAKEKDDDGEMVCPECDATGSKKFCAECGAKMKKIGGKKKEKTESNKATTKCPGCGETVKPTKFGRCPECAEKIDIPF